MPHPCGGKLFQCGDCLDNDGDGLADGADADCWGPCQDDESSFSVAVATSSPPSCARDCYFDPGENYYDACFWSHTCDPLETPPKYNPSGKLCAYAPEQPVPGSTQTCAELAAAQPPECSERCGPITPNGCDCFGCCEVPGAATPVFLGSTNSAGAPTCTASTLADPTKCRPCTIVKACWNPCESCELCIGKPSLPAECSGEQQCASGSQKCGMPCQPPCPEGQHCATGCCVKTPDCVVPECGEGVPACNPTCAPCPTGLWCAQGCCFKV